jgi:hypothetical protein
LERYHIAINLLSGRRDRAERPVLQP